MKSVKECVDYRDENKYSLFPKCFNAPKNTINDNKVKKKKFF